MSHILFLPSQYIVHPSEAWVSSADPCSECVGSGNLCILKGLIRSHRKCWVSCLLLLKCRSVLLHNAVCEDTVCIIFYCKRCLLLPYNNATVCVPFIHVICSIVHSTTWHVFNSNTNLFLLLSVESWKTTLWKENQSQCILII